MIHMEKSQYLLANVPYFPRFFRILCTLKDNLSHLSVSAAQSGKSLFYNVSGGVPAQPLLFIHLWLLHFFLPLRDREPPAPAVTYDTLFRLIHVTVVDCLHHRFSLYFFSTDIRYMWTLLIVCASGNPFIIN